MGNEMKKGTLMIGGCYALYGLLTIFWKNISGISSYYTLATRLFWTCAVCFVLLIITKQSDTLKRTLKDRKALIRILAAGVIQFINWSSYIIAVQNGRIMQASLGYYINPLIVVFLGMLLFKEKLKKSEWTAIALAAAGILYMIIQNGEVPYVALIIGGSWAVYGAIKKSLAIPGIVTLFIETAVFVPFALFFIIISEVNGQGAIGNLSGGSLLLLPMTGLVTSIPLLIFASGVKKIPYSLSGILQYINPTMSLIIGVFLFNEMFTVNHLVMFAFIWLAVLIFMQSKIKEMRSTQTQKAEGKMYEKANEAG